MKQMILIAMICALYLIGCGGTEAKPETPAAKAAPEVKAEPKAKKPPKPSGINWDKKVDFLVSLQDGEQTVLESVTLTKTGAKARLTVQYLFLDGEGVDSKKTMKAFFGKLGWDQKPASGFKSFWKNFFEGQPKDYYLGSTVKPRDGKNYRILVMSFKITPKYADKINPQEAGPLFPRNAN